MNVIILSDRLSTPVRWSLNPRRLGWLCATCLLLLAAALTLAFVGGRQMGVSRNAAAAEIAQLRAELALYESGLADVREASQRDLNALALRLGTLKAEATRLNALGERLTIAGQFDEGEFSFRDSPALGGPAPLGPVTPIDPGDFLKSLNDLEQQFARQSEQLTIIEGFLLGDEVERGLMPAGLPVERGYISSHYGYRADPFTGGRDLHTGVDFSGNRNDPIYAVADGVVSFSGRHFGYGNMVEIDHGNGYRTRYAHHTENLVAVGEVVKTGQQIARMGATGRATGVHLHFEVWHNSRPVNPMTFVGNDRPAPPAT